MSTECYPIATLPHVTKLYRDYLAMGESNADSAVRGWYGSEPLGKAWMKTAMASRPNGVRTGHPAELADALERQSKEFGAGAEALENVAKIRAGARAVVTGQQVGLLGGPLYVLLKAATAIARAKQATAATGVEHVPVFWLATEDHDLEEVDQVSLLASAKTGTGVETLRLGVRSHEAPVGGVVLGAAVDGLLERASELLGYAPVCDLLRECYRPDGTFGGAFARLMARLFADEGLIVMDAAGREFHALGARVLRTAIEDAEGIEAALLARSAELEAAGYHAQVLVKAGSSLLFLIGEDGTRQALRRGADGVWKAGAGAAAASYTTEELLAILDEAPERLSPNALLRPVFQDVILPTTAYVGGPAEIAYFAQSAVVYQRVRGRVTPVLPRLSATLIEPAIGAMMGMHEVSLPDAMRPAEELAQRLGARAMPIEAKRRLAAAGNALDEALVAAQDYLGTLDAGLGKSAEVSASKMRYQMGRLRRLAATFELQKEGSLKKHADAMTLHLFPEGHPQERVVAGVWFVAGFEAQGGSAAGLIARLVDEAASQCPGHIVVRL
jgi:bacillithiol synthase